MFSGMSATSQKRRPSVRTPLIQQMVRVPEYAESKSMSGMQVRNLIRAGVIPAVVIRRLILIDPIEADLALQRFKREAK